MAKKRGELTDELELSRKCFRALYDEYALQIYEDPGLNEMRVQYKRKCNKMEERIREMDVAMSENNDAEPVLGWVELYKPFLPFEETTRPLLAYLVRRITVNNRKEVYVEFLHEQEYELIRNCMNVL